MQVTAEPRTADLAADMCALIAFMMKSAGPDVFRAIGELELSLTQVKVLHILDAEGDERSLKELAEAFAMSLPAMSRSVEGLHQRGLVGRREDADDRRMKRVRITAAGRAAVARINRTRMAIADRFLQTLPAGDRRRLSLALDPIVSRPEVAACRPRTRT